MSKKITVLLAATFIFFSCQKSVYNNTDSANTSAGPEAKAQYDNTAFGVYKGVMVGSTGIIKMLVNNGDNVVKAYIFIDDVTRDTLTCTTPFTSGQAITNAHFVGRISLMDFSAEANGANPSIVNISIVGHGDVVGVIIHETSTQQVYCYQGTYTGSESGNFDCIKFGSSVIGLAKSSFGDIYQGNGDVVNNSFSIVLGSLSSGSTFGGSFNGDNCSGNWENSTINYSGSFTGKRTL